MYRLKSLASLLMLLLLSPALQADDKRTLRFGLLPFETTHTLFKRFTPLKNYLAEHSGHKITLETSPNFTSHLQSIQDGRYDLVFTAPHFVPKALDSGHYQLLVGFSKPLFGQFVASKDSTITGLAQLDDMIVATPSSKAIITKLGIYHLEQKLGIKPLTYHVYRTHNAAYQAVLEGRAAAAVISVNVYNRAVSEGAKLRKLGKTDNIPGSGILGHNNMPAASRQKLQQILADLHNTEDGRLVLKQIKYPGFRIIPVEEYDSVRKYLD